MTSSAVLRVPVEAIVLVALVLLLPWRIGRVVAALAGLLLGVLAVVRIANMGFLAAIDRPFDLLSDWSYFGPALGVLRDSIGAVGAAVAAIGWPRWSSAYWSAPRSRPSASDRGCGSGAV